MVIDVRSLALHYCALSFACAFRFDAARVFCFRLRACRRSGWWRRVYWCAGLLSLCFVGWCWIFRAALVSGRCAGGKRRPLKGRKSRRRATFGKRNDLLKKETFGFLHCIFSAGGFALSALQRATRPAARECPRATGRGAECPATATHRSGHKVGACTSIPRAVNVVRLIVKRNPL